MHGDKFPWSLRLGATGFARDHSEGFRENRKNFARNYREKFLQNYEKSANVTALNRGGAVDFARDEDETSCENREIFTWDWSEKLSQSREKGAQFAADGKDSRTKSAQNSGFTIIEVALVLAIAGLIFLVVFLALPALQRSQRDNARKQDAAHIATAIEQFYADGGDAADIPSSIMNYAGTVTTSSGSVTGPIANPQLDPYLNNLKLASGNMLWIYGNKNYMPTQTPGRMLGPVVATQSIDVYFGDKCWTADAPTGHGRYSYDKDFTPGSPSDAAVAVRLSNGQAYCVGVGR